MNGFENAWRKINEYQKERPRFIVDEFINKE